MTGDAIMKNVLAEAGPGADRTVGTPSRPKRPSTLNHGGGDKNLRPKRYSETKQGVFGVGAEFSIGISSSTA